MTFQTGADGAGRAASSAARRDRQERRAPGDGAGRAASSAGRAGPGATKAGHQASRGGGAYAAPPRRTERPKAPAAGRTAGKRARAWGRRDRHGLAARKEPAAPVPGPVCRRSREQILPLTRPASARRALCGGGGGRGAGRRRGGTAGTGGGRAMDGPPRREPPWMAVSRRPPGPRTDAPPCAPPKPPGPPRPRHFHHSPGFSHSLARARAKAGRQGGRQDDRPGHGCPGAAWVGRSPDGGGAGPRQQGQGGRTPTGEDIIRPRRREETRRQEPVKRGNRPNAQREPNRADGANQNREAMDGRRPYRPAR
jgi:hypothetical protein